LIQCPEAAASLSLCHFARVLARNQQQIMMILDGNSVIAGMPQPGAVLRDERASFGVAMNAKLHGSFHRLPHWSFLFEYLNPTTRSSTS